MIAEFSTFADGEDCKDCQESERLIEQQSDMIVRYRERIKELEDLVDTNNIQLERSHDRFKKVKFENKELWAAINAKNGFERCDKIRELKKKYNR